MNVAGYNIAHDENDIHERSINLLFNEIEVDQSTKVGTIYELKLLQDLPGTRTMCLHEVMQCRNTTDQLFLYASRSFNVLK